MADSMSKEIDDGGSAFPAISNGSLGMTLRDYFAGEALPSLIETLPRQVAKTWTREELAQEAYWMADAMLKARESNG